MQTTSITLTLLFRAAGAAIFGIISDRYGRKWPLVANLLMCCALQLGSGFVQTFQQFLAVRSLFGIAMGGVWGLAAATALENLPVEVRGFVSGVVQQGYAVGYLIAAVINLRLVPHVRQGWRSLFWTAAGISFFAAIVRALIPESEIFLRARRIEREKGNTTARKTKIFFIETKRMLKKHWLLCIYAVLLMTGTSFLLFPSSAFTDMRFHLQASTSYRMDHRTCIPRIWKFRKDSLLLMPRRLRSSVTVSVFKV